MDLKLVSVKLEGFGLAFPTLSLGFFAHVSRVSKNGIWGALYLHTLKSCAFSFFFFALDPMMKKAV